MPTNLPCHVIHGFVQSTAPCMHRPHCLHVAGHTGPWHRHPWGISGASLTKAWSSFPALPFNLSGHHMQFCSSQAPCTPSFPQPALLSSSASSALGQAFVLAHLVTVCLHPQAHLPGPPLCSTQSRAWHRVCAEQRSVGGMTLDGETNSIRSPQVHIPLLLVLT